MFLLLAPLILFLIYAYFTKNNDYWSKRGVKHDKPIPILGNHFRCIFNYNNMTEVTVELYNRFPEEKIVGYYRGRTPVLIIRDPELVKRVLCSDFSSFYNRGAGRNPKVETMLLNVFHGDGDNWKLLRQHTSPAYTIAKVKAMFPLVVQCAEELQNVVKMAVERGGNFDAFNLMSRFAIDFIGACGFGVDLKSINNENSMFRNIGKRIFLRSVIERVKMSLYELFPELHGVLNLTRKDIQLAMNELVTAIIKQRNHKPSGRNDFIDLLLELEKGGKIRGESIEKFNSDNTPMVAEMDMDFNVFVANVVLFFAAGFETSSTAMSYTLHELALHPNLQTEIQNEIDEVLSRYDGKFCYDAVSEMTLLSRAFKEAMRKFTPGGILFRVCSKRYTIPGTGVTIDPGVGVVIPAQALQMDEKYFDRPEEFRPERFTTENEAKMKNHVYMPFGDGPRGCIGSRLGEMQSRTGLAALLHVASVRPCAATRRRPRTDPHEYFVRVFADGLPLALTPRSTN